MTDDVNVFFAGGVTWYLARAALLDWVTLGIALLAAGALFGWRVNSAWLVLGGAGIGVAVHLLH